MSNTPIKSWIETVKPVAASILIVAILIQCAWSSFAHFVLFPVGILQSLYYYTGSILHPTFTGYVLLSICMGFLLCYIGGLRAKDFAIFHKQILPAVGFTLLAWVIIQLSPTAIRRCISCRSNMVRTRRVNAQVLSILHRSTFWERTV